MHILLMVIIFGVCPVYGNVQGKINNGMNIKKILSCRGLLSVIIWDTDYGRRRDEESTYRYFQSLYHHPLQNNEIPVSPQQYRVSHQRAV